MHWKLHVVHCRVRVCIEVLTGEVRCTHRSLTLERIFLGCFGLVFMGTFDALTRGCTGVTGTLMASLELAVGGTIGDL